MEVLNFTAVTHLVKETVPLLLGGTAYYLCARAALTRWWMPGKDALTLAKGRSWLLTLALSLYLSLAGVYYVLVCASTLSKGSSFIDFPVDHVSTWGPAFDSRTCARVMLALCALDLGIGVIDYPAHLGLLTGWVHHSVYIVLNMYTLHVGHTFALIVRAAAALVYLKHQRTTGPSALPCRCFRSANGQHLCSLSARCTARGARTRPLELSFSLRASS